MVNFNFSFDPGTTLQQMVGFEIAGRVWSSYLTDPITVNLQVGVSSSLGSKVIGGALPGMNAQQTYSSFTSALAADAKSADDRAAIREITGSSFSADYEFTQNGFLKVDGKGNSSTLNLTRAEAKALGLSVSGGSTALDGYVLFGSLAGSSVQWNYDYTRSAAAPANSLDFLTTALHEIGHVLGFVSGLDSPGWVDATIDGGGFLGSLLNGVLSNLNAVTASASPLDLFRYDTNVLNLSDNRTLSLGGTKVFALDNFNTPIASFATGSDTSKGGNGYQASHWAAGTNALMAPTLRTGTRSAISTIDLKAFDVLGWDLATNGISTAINLATLETQSKETLATRLGQTVSWLDANSTTAAQQLAKDGSLAVFAMAVRSQIYDLNRITPATLGGTTKLLYNQLFEVQGLFETIDELEVVPSLIIDLPSLDLNRPTPPTPGGTVSVIIDLLYSLNRNRPTPPTPGGTVSVIIDLPSLDLNRPTPPTPGVTATGTVTLSSNLSQSVQASTTGTAITATSNSLLIRNTSYFYGSSKLVAYEGSAQSAQQFSPLPVLVNLSVVL